MRLYFGGFLSSVVLQGLVKVAVGAGTFAFAHIKYGVNKCLEALLWGHGVAAEWQVVCHSGGGKKKRNLIFHVAKVKGVDHSLHPDFSKLYRNIQG